MRVNNSYSAYYQGALAVTSNHVDKQSITSNTQRTTLASNQCKQELKQKCVDLRICYNRTIPSLPPSPPLPASSLPPSPPLPAPSLPASPSLPAPSLPPSPSIPAFSLHGVPPSSTYSLLRPSTPLSCLLLRGTYLCNEPILRCNGPRLRTLQEMEKPPFFESPNMGHPMSSWNDI